MKTIKLPKNLKCLKKWLPKANYELEEEEENLNYFKRKPKQKSPKKR